MMDGDYYDLLKCVIFRKEMSENNNKIYKDTFLTAYKSICYFITLYYDTGVNEGSFLFLS